MLRNSVPRSAAVRRLQLSVGAASRLPGRTGPLCRKLHASATSNAKSADPDGPRIGGTWQLPFRQIPWALPFKITQDDAIGAFTARAPAIPWRLRAVRPLRVPFYVFEGSLEVRFTGVVGYDDGGGADSCGRVEASEYSREEIACAPSELGADTAAVSAVYAGFDYRRLLVRQALCGGVSDTLLRSAVPLTECDEGCPPPGMHVEAFAMKPSFAYVERITPRLDEVAFYAAEVRMRERDVRTFAFWRDGKSKTPAAIEPDYERVEAVAFELAGPRLHDKGVVSLPLWAVEYECLGKPYRAFVSALHAPPDGDATRVDVASLQHGNPWSATQGSRSGAWEATSADTGAMWKAIGDLRRLDAEANTEWRVQRYWLDEVSRVMPPGQGQGMGTRGNAFKNFLPGGGDVSDDDYALLGLCNNPPPTSKEIRKAFHALAYRHHPDLQQHKGEEEQQRVNELFQRIVAAHGRLRARHPEYLDSKV